ncbi:hypothetical protein NL676_038938 [Syzygium grande]|nr:hypothetical protein NL676_038938 [Syzygium grande]
MLPKALGNPGVAVDSSEKLFTVIEQKAGAAMESCRSSEQARWKFTGNRAKTHVIRGGLPASMESSPEQWSTTRRHGRELTGDLRFDEGFAEGAGP